MTEHEASRTLVKSPPELWAECSEAGSLARHLMGSFGEIKITRLEPETAVAWEGERVSGTVRIEPSGWGTKVTLTAQLERVAVVEVAEQEPEAAAAAPEPEPAKPEPEPEPIPAEPVPVAEPAPQGITSAELLARAGFFSRMRSRFKRPAVTVAPEPKSDPVAREPEPVTVTARPEPPPPEPPPPAPEPEPEPRAEAVAEPEIDAEQILVAALDSLGQAHHRPFSRA